MRGNPILNSLRTAEAAAYPALLIVSAICLGLVVGPVALLGLTDAGWVLGLALVYLAVAVVVLSVAVGAALSEGDEPDERDAIASPGAPSHPLGSLGARRRPSAVPGVGRRREARRARRVVRRTPGRRSPHQN